MIQAAQLLLSLSILIVLHEMGHFIPAKFFKTRVEKFYLFFDPWFSLFKFKRGGTEYGIGWLPLGGYVKISGMIDESMDKEQMKKPAEPWEFRSKPAWQRLIIMLGGVTVNVILGFLIYAMVLFHWGEEYLPVKNATYGIACDSLALKTGFKNGDKVLLVDGKEIENFNRIPARIILGGEGSVDVERDGQKINIPIKDDIISQLIKGKNTFITPRFPCEVDSVLPELAAIESGLQKGDKIVEVGGVPVKFFDEVTVQLASNKGKVITLKVERSGETKSLFVYVYTVTGTVGFQPKYWDEFLKTQSKEYSFLEAFPAGIRKCGETFSDYVQQLKVLFTVKDAHQSLGGFISIGKAYSPVWDWPRFWSFTAFLSIVLAIMNVLPIPALDGGHVMFLLYEVITRRKPNEKIMEYAQYAGMILLLSLLLYANGNDIMRLFSK